MEERVMVKNSSRPRARALALMLLVLPLASCGPIYDVPGDVCNDPTQNYTQDFAYECNQSL